MLLIYKQFMFIEYIPEGTTPPLPRLPEFVCCHLVSGKLRGVSDTNVLCLPRHGQLSLSPYDPLKRNKCI